MRNILVMRFDALGDTIVTIPFLTRLKKAFPAANIVVMASKRGVPALVNAPMVDKLLTVNIGNAAEMKQLPEEIRKYNFDVSFNLSEKIEGYKIAYEAKIPVRLGFRPGVVQPVKDLLAKFYCTNTAFYPNTPTVAHGLHEVERQFELLKLVGINDEPEPYSLFLTDESLNWADGFLPGHRFVALHLSNKWLDSGWSDSFVSMIIDVLMESLPAYRMLVTYGESEKTLAEKVMEMNKNSEVIFFSDPSFEKWAALLKKTRLLVTMDTSASHVASGISLPSVVVFPEKYFEHTSERWHPWKTPYRALKRKELKNNYEEDTALYEEEFMREILVNVKDLLSDELP